MFLIVPSYKNDNYWEPQKWSGKALHEAIAQLKKKYPNICDDKLFFMDIQQVLNAQIYFQLGYKLNYKVRPLFYVYKPWKAM